MASQSGDRPGLVPFQKFFAVLGYAVFSCLLIITLAEGASWIAWTFYWHFRSPLRHAGPESGNLMKGPRGLKNHRHWLLGDPLDTASASPAYDGYPWAEDFWEEERARFAREEDAVPPYEPFRLWGWVPWKGKFVNMDETEMGALRRTVNQYRPGCDHQVAKKIWFFGGSTAWGWSVPDSATIPSYLSEKLNAGANACFEVLNLGMIGYVMNQESIYLIQELKAGWRPDVAIFYDGINDALVGAVSPALPATHYGYSEIKSKWESRVLSWPDLVGRSYFFQVTTRLESRIRSRVQGDLSEQAGNNLARATLDNYESNVLLVQALGKAYGFEVRFFWQPVLLFGKKPQTPIERALSENQRVEKAIQVVYEEAENRSAARGKHVSLAHVFDQTTETIYTDWSHLGPRGNEIVAEAIAAALGPSPPIHAKARADISVGKANSLLPMPGRGRRPRS